MKPTIYVTCGDVNGIGLRCLAGALQAEPELANEITLVIDRSVLDQAQSVYGINLQVDIHSIYAPCTVTPGLPSATSSRLAILSLETALTLAAQNNNIGVTTLPINKHALQSAGWSFPGQTEMAASYSTGSPLMIMHHDTLRIALNTVHIPISEVSAQITTASTAQNIQSLNTFLKNDIGLTRPRIAVLGLNPHAGEHGAIGSEDDSILSPAIALATSQGIQVDGPLPADGFFGFGAYEQYDGVLAMYHDQGLIPAKLLSKGAGVNVTAGLNIVRTSPDHGTAYDKATDEDVDSSSVRQALHLCLDILSQRSRA